jgi:hypothetical protein
LTFENVSDKWGLKERTFSNGSAYADLDNDGDIDLVINNINDVASIYENHQNEKADDHFLRVKPVADVDGVTHFNTKIYVQSGAFEQVFEITSVRGMYSTSEHIAHFGLGNDKWAEEVQVVWPDGKRNILKNQKANQLVEVKYSDAKVQVANKEKINTLLVNQTQSIGLLSKHNENQFDDFAKQLMLPRKFSDSGPCFAIGDIDGDGLEDIFMGGSAGLEGRVFNQKIDGSFGVIPFPDLKKDRKFEDVDAVFFDVDLDEDLDLYIVSGGNEFQAGSPLYQDRLYINDGKGSLARAIDAIPTFNTSGSKVLPADFDSDGDTDLLITGKHTPWEYPVAPNSTLLRNKNGIFEDCTREIASPLLNIGMVNDAVWVDYDNDGMLDIAIVGEWMPFTLLQNNGTEFANRTREFGLDNSTGWWQALDAADFDSDGDQDFVLGNLGANFEVKASEDRPFHVFYDDFDNNGDGDLVLARHEGNKLFPVRERNRSVQQLPLLAEKIPTFEQFARSDVYEIYGRRNLGQSVHYQANTLLSYYVENTGNGGFAFHQLPAVAQLSPINDVLIQDFNKDGFLDILAAGNIFNFEVETVRPDAGNGVLLSGNGKGDFKSVNHRESGFFVPCDFRRFKPFRYLEKPVIVVGCNNSYYQFFEINDDQE